MPYKRIIIIFIFILSVDVILCQTWMKIYNCNLNIYTKSLFEHYDKGYLLTGPKFINSGNSYAWLMKTDINGNEKWSKSFGDNTSTCYIMNGRLTVDGGAVMIGVTTKSVNVESPIVIKVNACGEKEWCHIYPSSNPDSYGKDISLVPGGGYMAALQNWKYSPDVWLFRLDSLGYIIWQQRYVALSDTFWSPSVDNLISTTDSCFLITGDSYSPDSLYPGYLLLKIFFVKSDINGNVIFQKPWGIANGINSEGQKTIEDNQHRFYTTGRRTRFTAPFGDSPSLFKTSSNGDPISYFDLKSTSNLGMATTVNWFQDSTLVCCADWSYANGIDTTGVIKLTASGTQLNKKNLIYNSVCGFYGSAITHDNKLVLGGSIQMPNGYFNACTIKLNSNLGYDSVYTHTFTYDSLCPHTIISDTVNLNDCSLVTAIFDPVKDASKAGLHICPNPGKDKITVEFPQYLIHEKKLYGITASTIYYQWKSTTLEIYDLFGKQMLSREIPKRTLSVEMDVSSWHPGMYLARLVYNKENVASEKFIVETSH